MYTYICIYLYIYESRETGCVDISSLINEIRKIKSLDTKKLVIYNKKQEKTRRTIKI